MHGEVRPHPRELPTVLCERTHILRTKTLRSEQSESQRYRGGGRGVRGAPGSPRTLPSRGKAEVGRAPATSLLCLSGSVQNAYLCFSA